jgi:hypothetical protein
MKRLKSVMLFAVMFLLSAISVFALSVTLNHPSAEWSTTSAVLMNFTPVSEIDVIPWCAIWTNDSGTYRMEANYTNLLNNTVFTAGIGMADSTAIGYVWNAVCYNGTLVSATTNATFGVDSHFPVVSLLAPANNVYANALPVLNYSVVDFSNLQSCTLYTNQSGWKNNQTNASATLLGNGTIITYRPIGLPDGSYFWNARCNQTSSNFVWGDTAQNWTFVLDTTNPADIKFTMPANNTVNESSTPLVVWNQTTEINFQKYRLIVSPYLNLSNPIQSYDIFNKTQNFTTILPLPYMASTWYMMVSAYDSAGNYVNASSVLWYKYDAGAPVLSSNSPSDQAYTNDSSPDFNITVLDANPNSCTLYLSNASSQLITPNITIRSLANGTQYNLTPTVMNDGNYTWNIECNDSKNSKVNLTSSVYTIFIDTKAPTEPFIISNWHTTNNTDSAPTLSWASTVESNFLKYIVSAYYVSNGALAYQVNISSQTVNSTALSLSRNATYNFTVVAMDKTGLINISQNTTTTWYYVDNVCGLLSAGWNVCGATWTVAKNLSQIGLETGATFVSIWNTTHQWGTCNVGSSFQNCDQLVAANSSATNVSAVWVYMASAAEWKNRTWIATQLNLNISLSNITTGWNLIGSPFRNGRTFGHLGRAFTGANVSMFSMPYNNGTVMSYVNSGGFATSTVYNGTNFDYGRAMWVYYNTTGNSTFNIGSW